MRDMLSTADYEHTLSTVQWLIKKASLRLQDAILIGSHPAAQRRFGAVTKL